MDNTTTAATFSVNVTGSSTQMTPKRIAYWLCTGLVAFFIGTGGLAYATQVPDVVQGVVALGFPVYFVVLLGIWKVLGSIVIVLPGFRVAKEWAYAGIMFDLTGAAAASYATGPEWWHVAAPLSIGMLVCASWALRPTSRSLLGGALSQVGSGLSQE
jgi:DoxX-like protein